MAIAKPPFTIKQLKEMLGALKYYEVSMQGCLECIEKYNDLSDFYKEYYQRLKKQRENVLMLFDFCETDFDRDLLRRRYVYNENYFSISYDLAYSDRSISMKLKLSLERLSENTKNMQEFEY